MNTSRSPITTLACLVLMSLFMSLVAGPALAEDKTINNAEIQFEGKPTKEGLRLIKLFSATDPATVWLLIPENLYKTLDRCRHKKPTVGYDDKTRKVNGVGC